MLQICLMISSIDQYLSINYHYNLRQMSTRQLAERLTLVYMCFWILHSIPFGIFYEIQPSICCQENLEEVLWKDTRGNIQHDQVVRISRISSSN